MSALEDSSDVLVIGGGIIGSAVAYQLARRGMAVTLLDKGPIGYEQSTRNWGWVHQQVRYPHLIPLAVASVKMWEELSADLEADVGFIQGGNLSLGFDDADLVEFEQWRGTARDAGLETTVLTRDQVADTLPGMAWMEGTWTGALHLPTDGQADPDLVTAAFARAAERHGARIVTDCAVTGIDTAGGSVTGVLTERGLIRAPRVVVAAGAWSSRLTRPLGVRFPQRSVRSTVVRTTPVDPITPVTAWADGFTFRQDRAGRFVLAGGEAAIYEVDLDLFRDMHWFLPLAWRNRHWLRIHVGRHLLGDLAARLPGSSARREFWQRRRKIDPPADAKGVRETLGRFHRVFPNLGEVGMESSWAGNIDSTPDQAPIIGPVTGGPTGLLIATGFSGHGFALGPAAGRLAADLVLGDEPVVDPRPFRHARFAERDVPTVGVHRR
ncbi:MAG TPA: FAD-binding oxidoreductase [Dehalococcoidia bacterium]|nr:FAD-binding oxidoreductase [Dehalococcoidia bacterium]MDP6273853.1 FAD-binding oxidoreductase [Dehalococcoidia bacterium]MDP7160019.1 FAD-binding oxidoreductase [Dehalococcoidia bacterium]MDP7212364.1 FAD-binding oxidoreductase [Dehalococcoidia bacterium]MDP7513840.1 FAD-binding oxidoreductase [Dehalococcoidia bacterium]